MNIEPVVEALPRLASGLALTFGIATVSMIAGVGLGSLLLILRRSGVLPLQAIAIAFISVFRGLPLIAFLIWLYFGVTIAFGLNLSAIQAGIVCLSIQAGVYLAEIFRSAISAIPRTQNDAGIALGLTPVQLARDVIGPQALRIAIPPMGNEYIGLVKGSALVSLLGVFELMRVTQQLVNFHQMPFEFYTTAALIYVGVGIVLGRLFKIVERRLHYG